MYATRSSCWAFFVSLINACINDFLIYRCVRVLFKYLNGSWSEPAVQLANQLKLLGDRIVWSKFVQFSHILTVWIWNAIKKGVWIGSSYAHNHFSELTRRTFHISNTNQKKKHHVVNTYDRLGAMNFHATTVIELIRAHSSREQTEGARWRKQETVTKDKAKFFL